VRDTREYHTILGRKNGTLPRQSAEEKEAGDKTREERTATFKDTSTFLPISHTVHPFDFRGTILGSPSWTGHFEIPFGFWRWGLDIRRPTSISTCGQRLAVRRLFHKKIAPKSSTRTRAFVRLQGMSTFCLFTLFQWFRTQREFKKNKSGAELRQESLQRDPPILVSSDASLRGEECKVPEVQQPPTSTC
jgi:hypothetical protein